jgi:hypothetical protein
MLSFFLKNAGVRGGFANKRRRVCRDMFEETRYSGDCAVRNDRLKNEKQGTSSAFCSLPWQFCPSKTCFSSASSRHTSLTSVMLPAIIF